MYGGWRNKLTVFLLILTLLVWSDGVQAEIRTYIKRYKDITVSDSMLAQLASYDHFIDYFTSINYFHPRYRVSGEFVRALILAESGGDPQAISNKRAFGLGQILLPTGRIAAKELAGTSASFRYVNKMQLENLQREDLFDPATNILLTCYLIAKYNHRFNGRLDLVVSAWNAGENTESLLSGRHAPYEETKDLIGKVNGYYLFLLRRKGLLH